MSTTKTPIGDEAVDLAKRVQERTAATADSLRKTEESLVAAEDREARRAAREQRHRADLETRYPNLRRD